MEINYHLLTIFEYIHTQNKNNKTTPHNNRPKQLLLKASSFLSIGKCLNPSNLSNKRWMFRNRKGFIFILLFSSLKSVINLTVPCMFLRYNKSWSWQLEIINFLSFSQFNNFFTFLLRVGLWIGDLENGLVI